MNFNGNRDSSGQYGNAIFIAVSKRVISVISFFFVYQNHTLLRAFCFGYHNDSHVSTPIHSIPRTFLLIRKVIDSPDGYSGAGDILKIIKQSQGILQTTHLRKVFLVCITWFHQSLTRKPRQRPIH